MNNEEQIKQVIISYTIAVTKCDMPALSQLCTTGMYGSFGFSFRIYVFFLRLFFRKRIKKMIPRDFDIEKKTESKVFVTYVVDFGKRQWYERVVLIMDSGEWKMDGKFL
jgi:hypothetical protein